MLAMHGYFCFLVQGKTYLHVQVKAWPVSKRRNSRSTQYVSVAPTVK